MHISGTNVFVGIVVEYVIRVQAVLRRQKFWIYKKKKNTEFKNWLSGMWGSMFLTHKHSTQMWLILFSVLSWFILRPVFVRFILRLHFWMFYPWREVIYRLIKVHFIHNCYCEGKPPSQPCIHLWPHFGRQNSLCSWFGCTVWDASKAPQHGSLVPW